MPVAVSVLRRIPSKNPEVVTSVTPQALNTSPTADEAGVSERCGMVSNWRLKAICSDVAALFANGVTTTRPRSFCKLDHIVSELRSSPAGGLNAYTSPCRNDGEPTDLPNRSDGVPFLPRHTVTPSFSLSLPGWSPSTVPGWSTFVTAWSSVSQSRACVALQSLPALS